MLFNTDDGQETDSNEVDAVDGPPHLEKNHDNPCDDVKVDHELINLDHILSCVPYRDMLQDLFSGVSKQPVDPSDTPSADKRQTLAPLFLPVVTKCYEETFMREPMWEYERPCVMGPNCECNFISTRAGESFTGVEFILPSNVSSTRDDQSLPEKDNNARHMCVLCHRKLVQGLFYDIMYSGTPFSGVIQRYGNICNHAGNATLNPGLFFLIEYHLTLNPGIPCNSGLEFRPRNNCACTN